MKKFLVGLLFFLWPGLASAGVNCTLPFTFINGTLADANQVNADNAALVACLLNAAAAGNNNDITALLALTTPLTPAQGGSPVYIGGTSTGTANAQVVASATPIGFTLTRGNSIVFVAGFTNTAAATLNVNSTGATAVFRASPNGPQALTGGEIVTGNLVWMVYDGTQFQIISNGPQFGGFGPPLSIASAATTDLGTVPTHNALVTGTTTITSFGSTASTTYPVYKLTFSGALVLTQNATSLILPGGLNITTASGDTAEALYVGSGNWQVTNYTRQNGTSVVSPTPLCGFSKLVMSNGASNSLINWQWATSVLLNNASVPLFSTTQSGIFNITTGTGGTSTVGGMDGSAAGTNNAIYLYGISNGSAWNMVGSLNSSAPVMPAGYTYLCYAGAFKTNGASNLYGEKIIGNDARYVNGGANLTSLPVLFNGVTGTACNTVTPTYAALTVAGNTGAAPTWAPSTATAVDIVVWNGFAAATQSTMVAPSGPTTYGGAGALSVTNPPPLGLSAGAGAQAISGRIVLESLQVWACGAGAGSSAFVYGWKDAVNAN